MFSKNNSEFFALNTDEDAVLCFSKQNSDSVISMSDMNAPESFQEDSQLNCLPATIIQSSNYEELVDTFYKNKNTKQESFLPQGADTNIDYIISSTQNEIKNMMNENKFEEIIKYLNCNFPNFLLFNREILYILMKMKFFDLLFIQKTLKEAEDYYFEFFIHLGKETRRNWERKNKTFLKLLKNPHILKDKNVFAKNKEDFMLELNRALYKYLFDYNSKNLPIEEHLSNISHANSSFSKERSSSEFNDTQLGFNYQYNTNILISEAGGALHTLHNNFNHSNNNLKSKKHNNLPVDINFSQINLYQSQNNNSCSNNIQNPEEIRDISELSTKEEFSDFEDEIESHQACIDQGMENILSNNFIIQNNITPKLINLNLPEIPTRPIRSENSNFDNPLPHVNLINQNFLDFIERQNNSNSQNLIQSEMNIPKNLPNNSAPLNIITNDKNCNHKIYTKEFIPKTLKNAENLQKKLPMLKSFKPKYTKRENVDKKIVRRFKMFLKEKNKDKMLVFNSNNYDKHFWVMFLSGNLFPPMKYTDSNTGEHVDFKSFNTKYILWIFSKKGAKELYEKFLQEEASAVIANITSEYGVHDSNDLKQLESYVYNFSNIFDLNSVSTSIAKPRSASGNDFNALYPNYPLGNQAPTPDIAENDINEVTKPNYSNSKENKELYYDVLNLDRKLERSREFEFLSCDFMNGDSHYYNSESDNSEE